MAKKFHNGLLVGCFTMPAMPTWGNFNVPLLTHKVFPILVS